MNNTVHLYIAGTGWHLVTFHSDGTETHQYDFEYNRLYPRGKGR